MSIQEFINAKKEQFRNAQLGRVKNDNAKREQSLRDMQSELAMREYNESLRLQEEQDRKRLKELRTPQFLKNFGAQTGQRVMAQNVKQPSLFAKNSLGGEYKGIMGNSGVTEYRGPFADDKKEKPKK